MALLYIKMNSHLLKLEILKKLQNTDCKGKQLNSISNVVFENLHLQEDLQSHFELTRLNIMMKKLSRILKAFLIFLSGFKITCIQTSILI